jgi:S-(hydroxymethyl)glutathione dehydrogenase / alcohol dehydrogenase
MNLRVEQSEPGGQGVRAALLQEFRAELSLVDVEHDLPAEDEVVVRTVASGVCHSDRLAQRGDSPRAPTVPVLLGHEVAGVVESVGDRVSLVRPGDKVVGCAASFCGLCEWCQRGLQQHCTAMSRSRPVGSRPRLTFAGQPVDAFVGLGGFAERLLVNERAVVSIPDEMPLDRAAVLGCAVHTGIGAVRHSAGVRSGESVAVIGCGGVGLNVIQAARLAGASRIVAVDLRAGALARARQFGATDMVDASAGDGVQQVLELTSGGADHVFEVVGRPASIEQACAMARTRGTVTVVGLPRPGEKISIPGDVFFAEKRIQGSKMGNQFRIDIPWYCDLYLAGRLELDALISDRIGLDEINVGMRALDNADQARTVVVL